MGTKKILLLNADFVQAYSVSKGLKKAGYYVIAAMPNKMAYGYFSHYPDKKLISPEDAESKEYYEFVVEAIKKYSADAIIALDNPSSEFLSHNYEALTGMGVAVASLPWERFIVAHNKEKLMAFCEERGLSVPRTMPLTVDSVDEVAAYVGFPAMIKPNISNGARGIVKVNSLEELKAQVEDSIATYGECTLQQFIDNGDEYYNVMMYRNREGKIMPSCIIEIQRYFPIVGGSSSFCVTVENKELTDMCAKVLDKLDWVGMADFDVLLDKKEGFKIIEINPRVPASVHAAYASGINFPEIIARDILGEKPKEYGYVPGKKLRFLLLDVMWFLKSPKRFRSKESWFKFFGRDLYYQDTSKSDPLIFFAGVLNGISKVLDPNYRKAKLGMQSIDIEKVKRGG